MTLELFEITPGGEHEHAAVPEVAARSQVLFGRRAVRLLHESLEPEPARAVVAGCALQEVAVAGFRPVGDDAGRQEGALAGGPARARPGCTERRRICDDVSRR